MEQKLLQQAVQLTEQIMRTYYSQRDIYAVLDTMSPDATWIGPGEREKKYTFEGMRAHFVQGKDDIPSCEVVDPDLRAIDLGDNCCLVTGSMTIRTLPGSQLVLEVDQRISFLIRLQNESLEVVHMHISNPYGEMEREEYFPHKIGSQSYQYLQRLLNEKTEILDMITGNINGGLKGSNDDDTFSYFYVNEGLPEMLGFTHEEFMEKTGGTAVGAVYPPDLEGALADCERCFAQGNVYAAEYRMEKKDGTLMWVLDSGRKVVDSEGITRINSIITDITPFKKTLFDLEIERERYRMALAHITGAMCEYDVAKDSLTLYQQMDGDGEQSVKQWEITEFSQKMSSGTLSAKEDGDTFLDICKGKKTGTLEFLTRLPYQDEQWHWVQFSCSVITDHAGTPVRAIGILKDITKEKNRNLELLKQAQRDGLTGLFNHATVKGAIQSCLSKKDEATFNKCALIMVDLDHFKEVNDLNGHVYGDHVLMRTAQILEEVASGSDSVVGRMGGDEFLILTKNMDPKNIESMAENIINQVREIGQGKDYPVTCSIGVVYHTQQEESFTQFFERVDKALYQAKNDGRDRLFIVE